jgi:hypothetical protein
VRQGWINDFQGFFSRDAFGVYSYTNRLAGGGNEHLGQLALESPVSRRLLLGIYPVITDSIQGSGHNDTSFGDTTVAAKVMLQETEDVSLLGGLNIRVPTGDASTGNDRTLLAPFVAYWRDIGGGWAVRTGMGLVVPLSTPTAAAAIPVPTQTGGPRGSAGPGAPDATFVAGLGPGQTLTRHEAAPLGDFTYFLVSNLRQDLGRGPETTFLSITPGFRTHLGKDFFFIAGYEVPLVGPRPFEERLTFVLVKGF